MKIAITGGWLVFDNELAAPEYQTIWGRRGRVRMSAVSAYTYSGDAIEPHGRTLVWTAGQEQPWLIDGNHMELLDGYIAKERDFV